MILHCGPSGTIRVCKIKELAKDLLYLRDRRVRSVSRTRSPSRGMSPTTHGTDTARRMKGYRKRLRNSIQRAYGVTPIMSSLSSRRLAFLRRLHLGHQNIRPKSSHHPIGSTHRTNITHMDCPHTIMIPNLNICGTPRRPRVLAAIQALCTTSLEFTSNQSHLHLNQRH